MELLLSSFMVIIGFSLLIYGGDWLVNSAINIASKLKISPALVGLTIVAAGTSAPEFVTTLLASINGNNDIAAANVIGSNMFNLLAIIGLSTLILPSKINTSAKWFEFPFLVMTTIVLFFFSSDLNLTRLEGISFLLLFVFFIFMSLYLSKKIKLSFELPDSHSTSWNKDFGLLVLGIAGLTSGAHFALKGAIEIGQFFGLSDRIIGITIVSVGTGLPELATSTVAAIKKQGDLAIANVLGSNIMNTLIVLGTAILIKPLELSSQLFNHDIKILLAATVFSFFVILLFAGRLFRFLGITFIISYMVYIASLL
jgi:cation:H+ antiporter